MISRPEINMLEIGRPEISKRRPGIGRSEIGVHEKIGSHWDFTISCLLYLFEY